MQNRFRIDDFEPIKLEKAQKILDKRLQSAQESLVKMRDEEETGKKNLWEFFSVLVKRFFR